MTNFHEIYKDNKYINNFKRTDLSCIYSYIEIFIYYIFAIEIFFLILIYKC